MRHVANLVTKIIIKIDTMQDRDFFTHKQNKQTKFCINKSRYWLITLNREDICLEKYRIDIISISLQSMCDFQTYPYVRKHTDCSVWNSMCGVCARTNFVNLRTWLMNFVRAQRAQKFCMHFRTFAHIPAHLCTFFPCFLHICAHSRTLARTAYVNKN